MHYESKFLPVRVGSLGNQAWKSLGSSGTLTSAQLNSQAIASIRVSLAAPPPCLVSVFIDLSSRTPLAESLKRLPKSLDTFCPCKGPGLSGCFAGSCRASHDSHEDGDQFFCDRSCCVTGWKGETLHFVRRDGPELSSALEC